MSSRSKLHTQKYCFRQKPGPSKQTLFLVSLVYQQTSKFKDKYNEAYLFS